MNSDQKGEYMDTLTKREIIDEITTKTDLDRKKASEALETFIEIIKDELKRGENITLSGFGKWTVRDKHARRGRNPQTGEEITIPPRHAISFSLSNVLKVRLGNKDRQRS
jgi:integration host factor subunit alpha